MFEDNIFEKWLDEKANELIKKIGDSKPLSGEEMIILVLKAQSNHFHHLDKELRGDIAKQKDEMNKRFGELKEELDKRFLEQKEELDKRFLEQKEELDKRFEKIDKRFDDMLKRMDRFMFWSLGIVMTSTFFIIKYLG